MLRGAVQGPETGAKTPSFYLFLIYFSFLTEMCYSFSLGMIVLNICHDLCASSVLSI